jgi:branched-chain amino acid aminotransferase
VAVIHYAGRFVDDAEVSILDDGYRLGDGVFATMRAYDGVLFRPRDHLAQLAAGAARFEIPLPESLASIEAIASEAARRAEVRDARVRVTLTRGPHLSIVATAMDPPGDHETGVDVVTASLRAIPPACFDPLIKSTSYATHVLAKREASRRGAFEAIVLALDGTIASASMANVFVVRGNELLTPAVHTGCRPGVTRSVVLDLAPRLGLAAHEAIVTPDALRDADEAFLTSTRIECLPIRRFDDHALRRGPVTGAILKAFRDVVRTETQGEKS